MGGRGGAGAKAAAKGARAGGGGGAEARDFGDLTGAATDYLETHYAGWRESLPAMMREALEDYQGMGFSAMNRALMEGTVRGMGRVTRLGIVGVARAIRAGRLRDSAVVYRGIRLPKNVDAGAIVGKTFKQRSFTSVSLSRSVASQFSGHGLGVTSVVVRMTLPKGTRGAVLHSRGEAEVVLGRRTGFRIKSVKKKGNIFYAEAEFLGRIGRGS